MRSKIFPIALLLSQVLCVLYDGFIACKYQVSKYHVACFHSSCYNQSMGATITVGG